MTERAEHSVVRTVTGSLAPAELGRTLVHEHVWSDFTGLLRIHPSHGAGQALDGCAAAGQARWDPAAFPDNYTLNDVEMQIAEISMSRVTTIVDATPPALGRDPLALRAIAEATGVQIVMGCGWYLEPTHAPEVARSTVEDLAAQLVRELTHGVDGSGVRPGIIGEIGTGDPPSEAEVRCVRAAAIAAVETGVALTIHLHPWGTHGHTVISAALAEGLAPDRLLLNHVTTAVGNDAYLESLLDTGANLAFDLFGFDHSLIGPGRYAPSDHDTVHQVHRLIESGHTSALFVSQDVGVRTRLRRYGGWGYGHLVEHVVPLMLDIGIDSADVDQLLIRNPMRLLTVNE